jgi:hypothetical protein
MSYIANVYNVMLASPSDVTEELKIARELILEWNNVNSFSRRIVLLPINWKFNSYSSFGDRPQEIINQQLLKNADLLIGIFWTRIGTPTGKAISGTVEEIGEHIKSEKPTMLYFSNRDINPDRFDSEQYNAVQDMKKEYQKIGLTHSFNSSEDFRSQFQRQLSLIINNSDYFQSPEEISLDSLSISEDEGKLVLSQEAKTLLIEGSEDPHGRIMNLSFIGGFEVQTNKKKLNEDNSPRTQAKWKSAIEELSTNDLIKDVGYKGEIYSLTSKGYELADLLKSERK